MYIIPDKGLDKTFLKAGEEVLIYRSVLSGKGTVYFQHHYLNDSWQYPASTLRLHLDFPSL